MWKCTIVLMFALFFLASCKEDSSVSNAHLQEIRLDDKVSNADIIRNPVSAENGFDTSKLAKIVFEAPDFDFDTITEGSIVSHVYRFQNTGSNTLIITDAHASCGCTTPVWPKAPIAPGGKGEITVRFDSEDRKDMQVKPIKVTANTNPQTTTIYLRGYVKPAKHKSAKAPLIEN